MAGETAGFSEDEARALVDRGVAIMLTGNDVKRLRAAKAAKVATPTPELVLVRFVQARGEHDPKPPLPFFAGETAAFNQAIAAAFIAAGVAVEADKPEPAVAPTGTSAVPQKDVKVTFVAAARGYLMGEDATFSASEAKSLIDLGVAVLPGNAPKKTFPTTAGEGVDVLGRTDREGLEPAGSSRS